MSLCGRLGPVFPSSAVQTGRYPGTRMSVDPAYKVARSGARVEEMRWRDRTVIDGILGIDVCKNTLDVSISSYTKVRTKSFTNSTCWVAPSPGLADCPKDPTGSRLSGIHRAL